MRSLYDKLEVRGAGALSDAELLTLLVGDAATAQRLLEVFGGSLERIAAAERPRLRMIGGLGLRRAQLLHLAAEFGRRASQTDAGAAVIIDTSDDAARWMRPQLERLAYEECWAIYLTSSNRVIERQRISQGGVEGTVVDHRLVVKRALELLATKLILVHNHPSGAAEPSEQDRRLTRRIAEAAALFDIRLLDHLVIAREGDFSFRRAGLL